ncbi:hypothetical protein GCM10029976_003670 [Kribbella albertanoniae]
MRKLKGLEPFISVSVVNPLMLENGWTLMTVFREQPAIRSIKMNFCISFISTPIHTTADGYCSRAVGTKNHTIVSNESAEIIRMFNTAFDALGAKAVIYYPPALQTKIDELNGWIYTPLTTACIKLVLPPASKLTTRRWRKCLNRWHDWSRILGQHRYLTGNQLTEADIRLWTTLVRLIRCM